MNEILKLYKAFAPLNVYDIVDIKYQYQNND